MKSFFCLFAPLPALALLAGCGDSAETLFSKAKADFAAENYTAARVELASALEKKPGDQAMLELLVRAHLRLGDPDGAEAAMRRLTASGAKGADVQRLRAGLALLKNNPKQALALVSNDTSIDGWRIRAEANLALGNNQAAVAAFDKGMAEGGDIALATDYARYRLQTGDTDGAAQIYARMRAMDARAYATMVLAGDLAAARGQVDQAIAAYRQVLAAWPDRVPPMLALANQYDEKGDVDGAMALVTKAAKLAPSNPDVDALNIQLMSEKGQWEKIRLALQSRDSNLDPASATGMTYAEALLRTGHAEQARVLFNRAVLMIPNNPYARMRLGEAQLATGDSADAWKTLEPLARSTLATPEILNAARQAAAAVGDPQAADLAARLQPQRLKATTALVEKGEKALSDQNWSLALTTYRQLLDQGNDPQVLKRLAIASDNLGQGGQAIAYADRAVAISPQDPDMLYMAGVVRLDSGQDLAGARTLLQRAANADPHDGVIAAALAKAQMSAGKPATR